MCICQVVGWVYESILILPVLLSAICLQQAQAQSSKENEVPHKLYVGILLQKSYGAYYENGLSVLYSPVWQNDKLFLGFDYVTSRLGSAISSNALKVDNYIFSASYLFLKKS